MVKTFPSSAKGVRFDPWMEELRSHMPCGQNTEIKNINNIVTVSKMTLKMVQVNKILKKKKKKC